MCGMCIVGIVGKRVCKLYVAAITSCIGSRDGQAQAGSVLPFALARTGMMKALEDFHSSCHCNTGAVVSHFRQSQSIAHAHHHRNASPCRCVRDGVMHEISQHLMKLSAYGQYRNYGRSSTWY